MAFYPSNESIAIIRHLYEDGKSAFEISQSVHSSVKTARKWIQRIQREDEDQIVTHDLRRENRGIYKINDDELNIIIGEMEENPFGSVKRLPELLHLDVNEKTVRRTLKKGTNIRYRRPANKVDLSPLNCVRRLEYATDLQNVTQEEWRKTIAID